MEFYIYITKIYRLKIQYRWSISGAQSIHNHEQTSSFRKAAIVHACEVHATQVEVYKIASEQLRFIAIPEG